MHTILVKNGFIAKMWEVGDWGSKIVGDWGQKLWEVGDWGGGVKLCRCNRLKCPLARLSVLQCYNMGHNGHGINLYGVYYDTYGQLTCRGTF